MNLSMKLQVRQSQSLVMTPQLLQSIRLLQFGALELHAFIEKEVEQNPLLEIAPSTRGTQTTGIETAAEAPDNAPAHALTGAEQGPAAFADGGVRETWDGDDFRRSSTRGQQSGAAAQPSATVEDLAEDRPSLIRHVLAEISDIIKTPEQRRIGEALALYLDESGYIRAPAQDIAASLGAPLNAVETCLAALQAHAEPAGLFARSLTECLSLQLQRRERLDPVMRVVLANLDLLAKRDFAALKRLTGEDHEGLMDILSEIRGLDPKPGQQFASQGAEPVVPDVFVVADAQGGWRVRLNTRALPRLIVNNDYAQCVNARMPDDEREFLARCQSSAGWLMRSLDQRARTILKVAVEIMRRQDAFLQHGIEGLKPMTLASVAEAVSLHESTVSRVTANKYIQTPRGTFELKYFFTVAIAASDGGDAHSAESVKLRIRQMVSDETAESVLSDDDIAARLKDQGVELARRTVAKYREAMGIASSIQRRRELNARKMAS